MQEIKETDNIHQAWYDAHPKTPDELAAFVTKLLTEYRHDYGTIVHAAAAAALAAARTVDADRTQGGITGFQAGAIMWQFVSKWLHIDGPAQMREIREMLFPQYEAKFRTITPDSFRWLQEQAKQQLDDEAKRLSDEGRASPELLAHWRGIIDGAVPFGYRIAAI